MGSPPEEPEREESEGPQHQVQLQGFFLGRTPITQAQWREVANWRPAEGKLNWERELKLDPSNFKGDDWPVENVSWHDAMEFCRRLMQRTGRNYTLPSEAQWEYACRAGTTTPFHFGATISPELANYNGNYNFGGGPKGTFRERTTEVASFPANAWGLQDMHGNVLEWCADHWHSIYEGGPNDGSVWIAPDADKVERRLLRGGSWAGGPRLCRSGYRGGGHPDDVLGYVGSRICYSPHTSSPNLPPAQDPATDAGFLGQSSTGRGDRENKILELLSQGERTEAELANNLGGTSLQVMRRLLRNLLRDGFVEQPPKGGRSWVLTSKGMDHVSRS